ncbi:MAG: hypothetical protein IJ446_05795 [Oscillospiraceae bacterium]|nr:hypothetical protein [Oscillospiraceae bacterium]
MNNYEVLMKMYKISEKKAKKWISEGTTVYSDFEEHLDSYIEELFFDEEDKEAVRNMVATGKPVLDWEIYIDEEDEGKKYYISRIF